jgi:ferrochelatase
MPSTTNQKALDRRTGVLIANLGTPDAPTAGAIRRYLREFLSDPRVVELPRALWLPILYGFILPFRPRKLAHAYASVWSEQGSPLLKIAQGQTEKLRAVLGSETPVALGMSYGNPSLASALAELDAQGADRILLIPLYPQYSGTTTASVLELAFRELSKRRKLPELCTINDYHDHPGYIEALAHSVREHWQQSGRSDHLLMSFHSIPQKYVDKGDPYDAQCKRTAARLAQALALESGKWSISFQSRLGTQPWLQPYTDKVLPVLATQGIQSLDVICPGFSADCLETLEEVAIRYREDFLAAGGKSFRYIPALNASDSFINFLSALVKERF